MEDGSRIRREYVCTPDGTLVEGEIEAGKRYEDADFNRVIEIREREKKRVEILMSQIGPREKTLVLRQPDAR